MNYTDYIEQKMALPIHTGIDAPVELAPHLYPHQRDIVRWALQRGRSAVFADTGLGKTAIGIEWARHVSAYGRVLILAPLAVADQWVREAERFGVPMEYDRTGENQSPIVVANYEMLSHFDPAEFVGIILDESSILKAFNGKTRTAIIEAFAGTRFRMACTATPAPNDHTELGNHSEFLGVKSRVEMLAEYFVHDGGSTQNWRLKGHAEDAFWRWVCSWAAVIRMPSDLGYDDEGYALPDLRMHEHVIAVDHTEQWESGHLFAPEATTLSEQRASRRATMAERISKMAAIVEDVDSAVVWCELNAEGDALTKAIDGAVQIRGSDTPDQKRERLMGFADGKIRVLVTKPSIAGFGMNWQHCHTMAFVGASHSYEQTYQAIRRCWRFGQRHPVDVHVTRAETEGAIVANFERKQIAHGVMIDGMLAHVRDIQRAGIRGAEREWNEYKPGVLMHIPEWLRSES